MINELSRIFKFMAIALSFSFVFLHAIDRSPLEQTFTDIYKYGLWDKNERGEGTSGDGSTPATTEEYRLFLKNFMHDFDVHSVVDVGCGDWQSSWLIDWSGIDYTGYDVVKSVIEKNQAKFSQSNIRFIHADVSSINLPFADLLICKDVLQHLSHEVILSLIPQFAKFRYCLITNDVDPQTLSSSNPDIHCGGYRLLDLTQPPFNLIGIKTFRFIAPGTKMHTTKQVLLLVNEF